MNPSEFAALAARVDDEMISRGPWTTDDAERIVRGYYRFMVIDVPYDEAAHNDLRASDPGIPDWASFLKLLEDSELLSAVVSQPR